MARREKKRKEMKKVLLPGVHVIALTPGRSCIRDFVNFLKTREKKEFLKYRSPI